MCDSRRLALALAQRSDSSSLGGGVTTHSAGMRLAVMRVTARNSPDSASDSAADDVARGPPSPMLKCISKKNNPKSVKKSVGKPGGGRVPGSWNIDGRFR